MADALIGSDARHGIEALVPSRSFTFTMIIASPAGAGAGAGFSFLSFFSCLGVSGFDPSSAGAGSDVRAEACARGVGACPLACLLRSW